MRKYPKYKDSGIDWVGEIPEIWVIWKLKHFGNVILGKMLNNEEKPNTFLKPYLKASNVYWEKISIDEIKQMYFSAHEIKRYRVKKDDLLVNEGGDVGRAAIWNNEIEECYIQNSVHKITFKKDNSKFFLYLMIAYTAKDFFNSIVNQVSIAHLTYEKLIEIPFPRPILPEQHSIAQFLDHKTDQIDRFIANRRKQIELLKEQKAAIINKAVTKGINPSAKMKDSGIEWIGEVPEHWSVTKLKFVSKIFGRIGFRGYTINDLVEKGEGAITISPSNMKANEMNFESCTYISWFKYEESPEIKIFNDDVLFVKTGSTYGKVSMVENLQEPATINPQILVFKKIKTNPMFFFHQLRSKLIQAHVKTSVIGGTIPTISQEKIGNYYFLLPNKVEQGLIIEHITNETKIIDELITKYQKQIDLMQEYRTALISQAVTGKIDVRDWKPNTKIMVNG